MTMKEYIESRTITAFTNVRYFTESVNTLFENGDTQTFNRMMHLLYLIERINSLTSSFNETIDVPDTGLPINNPNYIDV